MATEKLIFSWQKPFLDSAVEWFVSKSESTEHIDLSRFLLLCPVARISRRLIEKLVFYAEQKNLAISAPQLLSLSGIYSELLPNKKIVTEAESRLLFFSLLKNKKRAYLFSNTDAESSELQLLDRADFLAKTYLEITKNGEPANDSIGKLLKSDLIVDSERWQDLSEIFSEYKQLLKQHSLLDTVDAVQLLEASNKKNERPLVLIGSFDLSKVISNTILAGFKNITSLVFSENDLAEDAFDSLGLINTDYWLSRKVDIPEENFQVLSNPIAETENILRLLEKIPNGTFASNITVGSCAAEIDKLFAFKAKEINLPVHLVAGTSLLNSEGCQALIAGLNYLRSKSFADLSYLLSIPAFHKKLTLKAEAQFIIDEYRIKHLQPTVLVKADKSVSESQKFRLPKLGEKEKVLLKETEQLLICISESKALADEWLSACKAFICSLELDSEQQIKIINCLENLLDSIAELSISDKALIALLSENFSKIHSTQKSEQDEIDIVGWLELVLDDAEYCYVLGMNEKNIPAKSSASSLLPEKVRQYLSLDTYKSRLARDKYILNSLLRTKKELCLSCSRMSVEGDGLILSRLFLEGSEENRIAILRKFFRDSSPALFTNESAAASVFSFELKQKLSETTDKWCKDNISVSALNLYYQCPYLFYLQSVHGLTLENPDSRELSGSQLGNLMHIILADFGQSDCKESIKKSEIEEFLLQRLSYHFNRDYSKSSFAEVQVQYFQIVERLQRFATWQAQWSAAGWKILNVEQSFNNPGYQLAVDDKKINLTGRIDRIDFNPDLKEYAIFDYKTSDSLNTQVFKEKNGWQDLQLAVYWLYCKEVLGFEAKKLALIPLSASDHDLQPDFIKIKPEQLLESKTLLQTLLRDLLNNVFWPPKLKASMAYDFKPIYQALEY